MATDKQKVLGLDSVEQIKTYVCFACENTKRDIKTIMDEEHDELKAYINNEISERAVLKDYDGNVTNYTVKSIRNDIQSNELDPNSSWELNETGNGQLSNTHIGWEKDGSGYIGKKEIIDNFDGGYIISFDKTINWDQDGIISFGKDVRPWAEDIDLAKRYADELYNRLIEYINSLHTNLPTIPTEEYIILNNSSTLLNGKFKIKA